MEHQVLILDRSYRPMSTVSWEAAISAVICGRYQVLEYSDKFVYSAHDRWMLPSVVVNPIPQYKKKAVKFDYDSILDRDNYTCAYCGHKYGFRKLSVDHIIPKGQGGKDTWLNCICACKRCNNRKDNRTPEQAGMKLLFNPIEPKNMMEFKLFSLEINEDWKAHIPMAVVKYIDMLKTRTEVLNESC